ncbi:MAG: hypothetical protein WBF58_04960 [Xanthobacteraceae bacterium]
MAAWVERRLLSAGGVADDNSSAFAVKPISAAQDPEPDAPPPDDPVVITVDATRVVEAAQIAQATSPDVDAENGTISSTLPDNNVARASQAARAYAQVMQAWLQAKASRPASVRCPTKPNIHADR